MSGPFDDEDEGLVHVRVGDVTLAGNLVLPRHPTGLVLFAHGSGSSRFSSRNRFVASYLRDGGLGTFLLDLLTPDEERVDDVTRNLRFDIAMLAERLVGAAEWLKEHAETRNMRVGLFGASTGGGAALMAAAARPELFHAVVSRGGRPDLAGDVLPDVRTPTLLIVGSRDRQVIVMNQEAYDQMSAVRQMEIVQGATHLFEEPGTLARVAQLARDWFQKYLTADS